VPVRGRAWHAGVSSWRGRNACNDFSIGVELEGTEDDSFTDAQYASLTGLVQALRASLSLTDIAAHSEIAPGRKTDPGARFDWARLLSALAA
jgi:AmpD protein